MRMGRRAARAAGEALLRMDSASVAIGRYLPAWAEPKDGKAASAGRARPNRVGTDKIDYEKSPYLFPFTRIGARRLAIAAGAAGCRLHFVQDVLRYAVVRLSGVYHDQRRPGVRDRKGRVALLCKRLFHRNGHGRRAVDFRYALLHVRDAPVRLLGRRRSMEGEPAAEPVRRPDLGRYPLHDAGGAAPQNRVGCTARSRCWRFSTTWTPSC